MSSRRMRKHRQTLAWIWVGAYTNINGRVPEVAGLHKDGWARVWRCLGRCTNLGGCEHACALTLTCVGKKRGQNKAKDERFRKRRAIRDKNIMNLWQPWNNDYVVKGFFKDAIVLIHKLYFRRFSIICWIELIGIVSSPLEIVAFVVYDSFFIVSAALSRCRRRFCCCCCCCSTCSVDVV